MDTTTTTSTTIPPPNNHRIKLNIGGTPFETTLSTLTTTTLTSNPNPIFIDRNPELFSPLLSLLRTHHLPSSTLHSIPLLNLLNESHFYNLTPLLKSSLSPPSLLPFDSSFSHFLSPPSHPLISSFSLDHSTLLLAHGGQLSSYDLPTLFKSSTFPTHLNHITSIHPISQQRRLAAFGSVSSPGLHFYDAQHGDHAGSAHWADPADLRTRKARVTAVEGGDPSSAVFAAFECQHGENAVLGVDLATLRVVSELGRQSGSAARSAAATKLAWVPGMGVLVGSSVAGGAFGYSGYVRVWDPRRPGGEAVWETCEPGGSGRASLMGDTMADVDVDREGGFMAKVGSKSGEVVVADMRKLGPDPWVYLEEPNPGLRPGGAVGQSLVVHCYKGHVFVGRDGGLEAWSRVKEKEERELGGEREWGGYRRNYVDKVEDAERGVIWKIQGGGNRLFVCRENVEGVEVWESSDSSGVKTVL